MSEPEEKGYEVKDKRKVRLDENGEAQITEEATEAAENPGEEQEWGEANLPPMDVYSLLKSFIGMLQIQAWERIGLMKNPITGRLDKDLAQAKVAIDSIAALMDQLQGHLSDEEQQELQALISNLRINFVQQSAKQS